MPEYIEVETAVDFVKNNTPCFGDETSMRCVERSIRNAPTSDVVEVVRCAECRHYNPSCMPNGFGWCEYYNSGATDDHYCSHGERKGVVDGNV